jgi:hypothetical protein
VNLTCSRPNLGSIIHSADDNLYVNEIFFENWAGTGWTDSNFLSFPISNHSPTDAVRCWKKFCCWRLVFHLDSLTHMSVANIKKYKFGSQLIVLY